MMKHAPHRGQIQKRRQSGAAAIEFALLFVIFFAVVYGIVSYALVMTIRQGLTQAAAESARVAVKLDQLSFTSTAAYESAVAAIVRDTALKTVDWMPDIAKAKVSSPGNITTLWVVSSRTVTTGGNPLTIGMRTLTVKVIYPDYAKAPVLPIYTFPGIGPVPAVPKDLVGTASIQLQL